MNEPNKTQQATDDSGLPPKAEKKEQGLALAETMHHVVRAGGTQQETGAESSQRQPSSNAKSSVPNRAIELPAKSSQPLPSSQDSRHALLLLEGVPDLPVLHPEERYRLEGEFARGGLGRILKAHDERMNRPVAMKEMLRRTGGNAEKRFLREALLTAKLEHPGIIPVHLPIKLFVAVLHCLQPRRQNHHIQKNRCSLRAFIGFRRSAKRTANAAYACAPLIQ